MNMYRAKVVSRGSNLLEVFFVTVLILALMILTGCGEDAIRGNAKIKYFSTHFQYNKA